MTATSQRGHVGRIREVGLRRRPRRDPVPAARRRRLPGVEEPRPEPGGQGQLHAVREVPRRVGPAEGQQGRRRRAARGRGHRARGRRPLRQGHVQDRRRTSRCGLERRRDQEGDARCSATTTSRSIPASPSQQAPDGTTQTFTRLGPTCDDATRIDPTPQVRRVPADRRTSIEATTPDQLLHRIEQTLPNVDRVLESVRDLSEDVRRIVNGPLQSVATRVDGLVQREAGTVAGHHRARRSLDEEDRADHERPARDHEGRRSADREASSTTSTTRRPTRRIWSRPRRAS